MEVPRKEKVLGGGKDAGFRIQTRPTAEMSDLLQVTLILWPPFLPLRKIKTSQPVLAL